MADYYESLNAQQLAHEALRRTGLNENGGGSISKANGWLTMTADIEGVKLDDPRVSRARKWLEIQSYCTP